ncbi:unnamed protein product [Caenorhabditis bovis]|uniref:Guided entry of tail-anchored proteins factor 1 n=1 Tax=Caenorhabditis bovis TaxID=2654633 RepID=A0A8S1EA59_9PELO|nr:unnamed protein product [Caenorhabditis bovis]
MDAQLEKISIYNGICCFVAAFLAIHSAKIISAVSSVKLLFKEPVDPRIVELQKQINVLKRELNSISPTDQFAAYFKKDRELNKLRDQLAVLESSRSSPSATNLKIEGATRIVIQLCGLFFLRYVSSIVAFCMPDNIFWPFNFLLRFPALIGNDTCPPEFCEVSGFAVFFLIFHIVSHIIKGKRQMEVKQKLA